MFMRGSSRCARQTRLCTVYWWDGVGARLISDRDMVAVGGGYPVSWQTQLEPEIGFTIDIQLPSSDELYSCSVPRGTVQM